LALGQKQCFPTWRKLRIGKRQEIIWSCFQEGIKVIKKTVCRQSRSPTYKVSENCAEGSF
jgi:hypothetical protein